MAIKNIEKVIRQNKPFVSPYQKVMVNILYTNGWLMDRQKQFFSAYAITLKQYNILRILRGAGKPLTTSVIRNRMLDKMSDTTRIIDRMLKKGWVDKKVNDLDRRLVDVVITEAGYHLLERIDANVHDMEQIAMGLSHEEAEKLSYLLDKMRSE